VRTCRRIAALEVGPGLALAGALPDQGRCERMGVNVFAYGSNMCSTRFRAHGVTPEAPGVAALLRGHRLVFNKVSADDGPGKANLMVDPSSDVWGVLYSIPADDLGALDRGEGGYNRQKKTLDGSGGARVDAWIYFALRPIIDSPRPYSWYRDFLVIGAKEHGLPAGCVRELEAIETEGDPDPARDRARRELM